MISAYGEKHLMLINKVAVYPNATVQLDSVNRLVLSKVVRRSCRRDSPQKCQHYHSINFMKYFTCQKNKKPAIGKAFRRPHYQLGTVRARAMCKGCDLWLAPMEMFDLKTK